MGACCRGTRNKGPLARKTSPKAAFQAASLAPQARAVSYSDAEVTSSCAPASRQTAVPSLSDHEAVSGPATRAAADALGASSLRLAGGRNPRTVFSHLFEGSSILAFLHKSEATRSLRPVCRELRDAVDSFVWRCPGKGCSRLVSTSCYVCGKGTCDDNPCYHNCDKWDGGCGRDVCAEHHKSVRDLDFGAEYCTPCYEKMMESMSQRRAWT